VRVGIQDLERLRGRLTVPAGGRIRLLVEADEGKLALRMECISCEELLGWDAGKGWWTCPVCQQETTEQEAGDLFSGCHRALGIVLDGKMDDGKGAGRWVDRFRGLTGI
jgi:ribosomal protein L37AE/L43A